MKLIRPALVFLAIASCHRWAEIRSLQERAAAESACSEGDLRACGALSQQLWVEHRFDEAWPLAVRACDAGVVLGCASLGAFFDNGKPPATHDETIARTYLKFACERGVGWACVDYGSTLMHTGEFEEAAKVSLQACDAGERLGCTNYGYIIDSLWQGHLNQVEARRIFLETCDGGFAPGCRRAGVSLTTGSGGPVEYGSGLSLLQLACYQRDDRGCTFSGLVLQDAGFEAEAVRFYRRGCALGGNCLLLAQALASSVDDGGRDVYELLDMTGRACTRQGAPGCALMARTLLRPEVRDVAHAIVRARSACTENEADACELLRELDAGPERRSGEERER